MKAINIISNNQILFSIFLLMTLFTLLNTAIIQYYNQRDLPTVVYDEKSNDCYKVINYKNGDAYNCEDLKFLLRKFKVEYIDLDKILSHKEPVVTENKSEIANKKTIKKPKVKKSKK